MNPILYAFLSDNFKKSFLKACTCAAGQDVNATLHLENSIFPTKRRNGSERLRTTKVTTTTLMGCQAGEGIDDEQIGETGPLFETSSGQSAPKSTVGMSNEIRDNVQTSLKNGILRMNVPLTQL